MPITFVPVPSSLPFAIIQKYESKNPEGEIVHKFTVKRHADKEKPLETDITFRSKVISRQHAELVYGLSKLADAGDGYSWMIRDIGSSSGTFVNGKRLSPASQTSNYFELKHHDQLQLGVDYQQRHEDIYKSVKCKIELNQDYPLLNHSRYQELNLLIKKLYTITHQTPIPAQQVITIEPSQLDPEEVLSDVEMDTPNTQQVEVAYKRPNTLVFNEKSDTEAPASPVIPENDNLPLMELPHKSSTDMTLPECCICLMPLKLYHGLFISPCCHLFHYHCVRQLCIGYFLCPMYLVFM